MCTNPITIKNLSYHRSTFAMLGGDYYFLPTGLSSNEPTITVPCGICAECRHNYFSSILQRGIVESLSSYLFFVTLTYDNEHLPALVLPHGEIVYYTDYEHIKLLFKRFRRHKVLDRDFRYLVALEYGDNSHRPHVHLLLFVARKPNDTSNTPYFIERLLFDNIGNLFAENVGTRKYPVYEKLFTYAIKYTSHGIETNYFVKYVEPNLPDYACTITDVTTHVKTIRYLMGYVNKGSSFDDDLLSRLDTLHDDLLKRKLKTILRSKIRYSKGFGCGFDQYGVKQYFERSFVKTSFPTAIYSTQYDIDENDINQFLLYRCDYRGYATFDAFIKSLKEDDLYIYLYIMRSYPHYVSHIYNRYFRKRLLNDCISAYFNFLKPYNYVKLQVHTYEPVNSDVYNFIRQGVEQGITARVPFLAFPVVSDNKYISLCKYYRERFITPDDILRMYQSIGVNNFDEWRDKFVTYVSNIKESKSQANKVTHVSELIQKNCISKSAETNLYSLLFTKC